MSVNELLKEFSAIDGFAGVAVFTPSGEPLGKVEAQDKNGHLNLNDLGILANNVLLNAQKASLEMGTGKGELVHIEAEKAHILTRCLNEGTDSFKTQPGKAHIHLVLVLSDDSSIGLAKMRINSLIKKLAEDLR